jgi:hypothetical protein
LADPRKHLWAASRLEGFVLHRSCLSAVSAEALVIEHRSFPFALETTDGNVLSLIYAG